MAWWQIVINMMVGSGLLTTLAVLVGVLIAEWKAARRNNMRFWPHVDLRDIALVAVGGFILGLMVVPVLVWVYVVLSRVQLPRIWRFLLTGVWRDTP